MMNYDIFHLLYSEFRHKFEGDNLVFTQKYVVGNQRICIHCLKDENKLDVVECLDFLNKSQEKFVYVSDWTSFYFNCFDANHNIVVYQFLSKNEDEIRMYEHFCRLAIS